MILIIHHSLTSQTHMHIDTTYMYTHRPSMLWERRQNSLTWPTRCLSLVTPYLLSDYGSLTPSTSGTFFQCLRCPIFSPGVDTSGCCLRSFFYVQSISVYLSGPSLSVTFLQKVFMTSLFPNFQIASLHSTHHGGSVLFIWIIADIPISPTRSPASRSQVHIFSPFHLQYWAL